MRGMGEDVEAKRRGQSVALLYQRDEAAKTV